MGYFILCGLALAAIYGFWQSRPVKDYTDDRSIEAYTEGYMTKDFFDEL